MTTKSQKGISLIEVMVSLSIFALVVGGALSIFSGASASQTTTQMKSDISAIRSSVKGILYSQGNYGTSNIGLILIDSQKMPSSMTTTGTGSSRLINHTQGGTVTVTGATTQYTLAITHITNDVCIGMVVGSSTNLVSVQINTGTAITSFPVTPDTAAAQCNADAANAITYTVK